MAASSQTAHFSVIQDKMSFIGKLGDLNHATADDSTPTPGYLYQQIIQWTFDSGSFCHDIVDYLVDRLSSKSCHVKLKTLRIIHHVLSNGHPEFLQALRKQSHGIKEATKFNGPPDPLHGNAPYLLIRKEAKELSQLLFDESFEKQTRKRTEGSKYGGGIGSAAVSSPYQGFGNTQAQPELTKNPQPSRINENFNQYKPANLNYLEDLPSPLDSAGSISATTVIQREPIKHTKTRKHRPGLAGGGWENNDEELHDDGQRKKTSSGTNDSSGAHSSTRLEPGSSLADSSHDSNTQISRTGSDEQTNQSDSQPDPSKDNYSAEKTIIESMLQSEKLLTSKQAADFVKRCCQVNCEVVVRYIAQRLTVEKQTIKRMTLMLLIEALLRSDVIAADVICQHISQSLLSIFSTSDNPQKTKAQKILRILQKLCPRADPELFSTLVLVEGYRKIDTTNGASTTSAADTQTNAVMYTTRTTPEQTVHTETKSVYSFIKASPLYTDVESEEQARHHSSELQTEAES